MTALLIEHTGMWDKNLKILNKKQKMWIGPGNSVILTTIKSF